MAYFIPRLATAPNYSEGTSNYCLRRQKEGKNRSKKTPTTEWFHSNRFAPGFISYHGWLRSHRAHIFPIRAAMPPQALLPSLATAACVAQPTSGTPLCRPPPPPALIWDPVLVLCLGNPQHGLRGGGGRVGHPKAQLTPSAHSFTPLPPGEPKAQNTKRGQNQSRGHRERAEHSRDRPAAVWGQRRHRQWAANGALRTARLGWERGKGPCVDVLICGGCGHNGGRRPPGQRRETEFFWSPLCCCRSSFSRVAYGAAAAGGAPGGGGVTPSAGGGGCAAGGYMPLGAARGTRGPMRPPAMGAMPGGAGAPVG